MLTKIRLLVDLGYAFDYFSILELKNKKGALSDSIIDLVRQDIISQISEQDFNKIYCSVEYKNLLEANIKTFEAVDRAKQNNITAKEVDEHNMLRYYAKMALQQAYSDTTEHSPIEIKV